MKSHRLRKSWSTTCLVVLALMVAPVMASGRFVCARGMRQAGSACPRCHHGDARSVPSPCCKWSESKPLTAVNVVTATLQAPVVASVPPARSADDLMPLLAWAPARVESPPPGVHPPGTTVLRL